MGDSFSETSARNQARSQQVTHYVNQKYPAREKTIEGDPQIINLPFKCIEGDLIAEWGSWAEGRERFHGQRYKHQQFSVLLSFKVTSVGNYTEEYKNQDTHKQMDKFNEDDMNDEDI